MIVICEECGKKYSIDPLKIKGDKARFKCKVCDFIITVIKPVETPAPSLPKPQFTKPDKEVDVKKTSAYKRKNKRIFAGTKKTKSFNLKGFGLRSKMLLLFFVIPIILIITANILYLWQMNNLSSLLTSESSKILKKLVEEKVADNARTVAAQCNLYLDSHPGIKKEDFNYNAEFKRIAVQKVGMTGYTALYEMPDLKGVWQTWVHVNPKIIGIDMSKLKKPLGKSFAGFWKVYTGVKEGGESRGYYTWWEKDGSFREKFMVCTPVEGTSFIIAATTYVDEFTGPVKLLKIRAKKQTVTTRNIVFGIFIGTILLIGFIVSFYGNKLAGRIKSLTEVSNRISVGELDAEIDITGEDEIGNLGEAISRMQDSIRLSIERLRRRR
ncbi:MAG: zinc-ribbon domain-containing protein [Deltaproteobacteria bacterium]|nr:zinc-ribbon domain-containing protein [Deltaproteobacteria bacterium]MBW2589974.1 zinc-ribbon domain-containing protein [Deltaproteobacteria bacterium]